MNLKAHAFTSRFTHLADAEMGTVALAMAFAALAECVVSVAMPDLGMHRGVGLTPAFLNLTGASSLNAC